MREAVNLHFRNPPPALLDRMQKLAGRGGGELSLAQGLQGYLAHKKTPHPLGPPQDPRHRLTVGSCGGAL